VTRFSVGRTDISQGHKRGESSTTTVKEGSIGKVRKAFAKAVRRRLVGNGTKQSMRKSPKSRLPECKIDIRRGVGNPLVERACTAAEVKAAASMGLRSKERGLRAACAALRSWMHPRQKP
jgi:hypothetical protein